MTLLFESGVTWSKLDESPVYLRKNGGNRD